MRSIFAAVILALGAVHAWPQVALTPLTPAFSPSPVFVPGSPALSPTPAGSNLVTTNATLAALSASLFVLQTNLQQTLPVLSLFNDNFNFVSLGDNGVAAASSASPPGNFSSNLATNFGQNLGVNMATPTGRSLFNTVANNPTTPAAAGLPAGFSNVPVTRDTLRALLVLQSDIRRMLPLVNALNNGTTNFPGSFTNLFGIAPTSP